MKDRFVKLNELTGFDDEFKNALGELEQRIFESYNKFMPLKDGGRPGTVPGEHPMFTEFKENFGYDQGGRKYLRLVTGAFGEGQTSVWGFIAKSDFDKVNKLRKGNPTISFKEGDLLKSAGWNTPALNASRGNIFDDNYKVQWTGPNYL
jgi:hypothetical protein